MKACSIESKAFSISAANKILSFPDQHGKVYIINYSNRFTYKCAFYICRLVIIKFRITFILSARTLDAIFVSKFIREIGLQLLTSLLSLSFFSISIITACFSDVDSSLTGNEWFRDSSYVHTVPDSETECHRKCTI